MDVHTSTFNLRITTPSVDSGTGDSGTGNSGNQSEFSPVKQEGVDNMSTIAVTSTHENNKLALSNGDRSPKSSTSSDVLNSEEKDHFDTSSLLNYEGELKKITQKIHTLTVNSDMKGNAVGGIEGDTHSSSSTGCLSPMSSEGGVYPQELMDNFALNLHR